MPRFSNFNTATKKSQLISFYQLVKGNWNLKSLVWFDGKKIHAWHFFLGHYFCTFSGFWSTMWALYYITMYSWGPNCYYFIAGYYWNLPRFNANRWETLVKAALDKLCDRCHRQYSKNYYIFPKDQNSNQPWKSRSIQVSVLDDLIPKHIKVHR